MLSFLSIIPILGPIFQALAGAWEKHEDVTLKKQEDVNKTALGKQQDTNKTDVAVIQTRAQVAIAFKDDLGVRLMRDIVMFFPSVWTGCYFYNLIYPTWNVGIPPTSMQYIPYAIIAFLFATNYRGNQ